MYKNLKDTKNKHKSKPGLDNGNKFVRAKKSLGQNFLKSKAALASIVDTADINASDIVIEVGPGKGVLTERLLMLSGKVIAIEKDRNLALLLREKFAKEISEKKLDLIEGDILEFDTHVLSFYKNFPYKVVANIPYYITGAILRLFLESDNKPKQMVLLVQKEVADRIVARDGKESILSLSVKAFGNPKYIEKVPKKYFSPVPKVDSAIISISDISKDHLGKLASSDFFNVVKAGFAHKRKFAISNLGKSDWSSELLKNSFEKVDISLKSRAEDISFEKWLSLVQELHTSDTTVD